MAGPKPMVNVLTWTSHHLAARKWPSSWMKMTRPRPERRPGATAPAGRGRRRRATTTSGDDDARRRRSARSQPGGLAGRRRWPVAGRRAAGGSRSRAVRVVRVQRPTSCRAQRSAASSSSSVGPGVVSRERPGRPGSTRAMSRKASSPARNRPTAASLAALSTAPQVPPRRGHLVAQFEGRERLAVGLLEVQAPTASASPAAGPGRARRSG